MSSMASPNPNPYRIQYTDVNGTELTTDPIYGIHQAEIVAATLAQAGNRVDWTFRDNVGFRLTCGAGNGIAPPLWTRFLGGRP